MPVQMYLNQGAQDNLLFCNDKSFFTHPSYSCSTNFQHEYRDIDPVSTAKLGSTARFTLPKAADLLGNLDLIADVARPVADSGAQQSSDAAWYWVNKLGFAAIEKMTLSIGANMVEEITGEQLDLINELMNQGADKLGWHTIMRDCKPASGAVTEGMHHNIGSVGSSASGLSAGGGTLHARKHYSRELVTLKAGTRSHEDEQGHKLIVPLGLFFTKQPNTFFPLGSIAGCNDVTLEIKFRPASQLIAYMSSSTSQAMTAPTPEGGEWLTNIKLRCSYVHLTGNEAALQMNKEHVRLMRQWKNLNYTKQLAPGVHTPWSVDLSFLHPVAFLVVTFRKQEQLENTNVAVASDTTAAEKGFFQYYGDGRNPCLDHTNGAQDNLTVKSLSLTLNGQERHPGLTGNKLDLHYLKYRVLPQMFSSGDYSSEHLASLSGEKEVATIQANDATASNLVYAAGATGALTFDTLVGDYPQNGDIIIHTTTSNNVTTTDKLIVIGATHLATSNVGGTVSVRNDSGATITIADNDALKVHRETHDVRIGLESHRHELLGAKNIFVYPFCLSPQTSDKSPSGSVNFSKVSHAKFTAEVQTSGAQKDWRMDIYAVGYNWLQLKNGRGLLSFA